MQTAFTRPSRAGQFALATSEAMWLAALLALPLVMNVGIARSFEAAKMLVVAPVGVLCLAGLLAAWLARAGGAAGGNAPSNRLLFASAPALAFFALLAIAALGTASSEVPWVAFFGDYFRREGLAMWLLCGILFSALLFGLRQREQLERLIDVLLLAGIIPCVYAIMQRFGYDFFLTQGLAVGTAGARPGGTMGNPTFLASVLLLLIPLTVARVLGAGDTLRSRAPWVLLLALQMIAVLLTQSRGPLLGIAVMLFVLLLLLGAQARARTLVLAAFGAAAAAAIALLLINLVPALAQATAGTPLQRFVYSASDSNITSRLGIWQAGVDAFTHAGPWQKLVGYGPDAASLNYFNWMPALVQRNEGFSETIDRLHSEFLETLLSFGVAGLLAQIALLSTLVWAAAQRLLPLPAGNSGKLAWLPFAALVAAGTIAGALLAYFMSHSRGLLPIGAGVGLTGAWSLFLAWRVWRHVHVPAGSTPDAPRIEALLIAALLSALIGSWTETQVGVPTIALRALAAVYAALLILTVHSVWNRAPAALESAPVPEPETPEPAAAEAGSKSKKKRQAQQAARDARREARKEARQEKAHGPAPLRTPWYPVLGWAAGLAVVICISGFFPPLSGTRMLPPAINNLGLIVWPLLATVIAALLMSLHEAHRSGAPLGQAMTRFLLWTVPPVVICAAVYAKLGGAIQGAEDDAVRSSIAALYDFSYAAYVVLALGLAIALYRGDRGGKGFAPATGGARTVQEAPAGPRAWGAIAILAAGAALSAATFAWARADIGADVGAKLAAWAQTQGRPEQAARFLAESRLLMPQERRFAGSFAARMIEAASRDAAVAAKQPEVARIMRDRLLAAEQAIAHAHTLVPRDPWITFAYGNVNQYLALGMLSTVQPAPERKRRAEEARKYLKLAHEQFPGHPWILRNWAQLEFDQGDKAAAYARLDEMEKLDRTYIGAYTERIKFARLENNAPLALTTVRRGLQHMPKGSDDAAVLLQELINVPRAGGRIGEAISGALEYTATQPQRIGAWRQLAELYELNNQRELALGTVQDALLRFASVDKKGPSGQEYAVLQSLVSRINYGAAGAPKAAPGGASTAGAAAAAPAPAKP